MTDRADQDLLRAAEVYARYPSGPHGVTASWVFGGLAVFCMLLSTLTLFAWTKARTSVDPTRDFGLEPSAFLSLGLGMGGLGLLMVLLTVHQRNKLRRFRRSRELLRQAVHQLGAQWLVDGRQVAQWLTQHWGDHYPHRSVSSAGDILRAAAWVDGFPVLVEITPNGFHETRGEHGVNLWWARAVVGAELPPGSLGPNDELVRPIAELGYEPQQEGSGLIARADRSVERTVRKHPERVVDVLRVGVALARVAKKLGARPVVRR